MTPIEPTALAVRQMDDPAFLRVVLMSVLGAIAGFALVGAGVWYAVHGLLNGYAWLAWLLGGVGAALLAHYFFLPVAGAVATMLSDAIAGAVERRFYPNLAPARPAPLSAQVWDGLVLGLWVAALQVLSLIASPLLPGVSVIAGYAIAAWAVGRGLFVTVAMRRMSRADAHALYARRRGLVLAQGALAVAGSLVPVLNLLVPVLAVAAMVHVLHGFGPVGRAGWAGLAGSRTV